MHVIRSEKASVSQWSSALFKQTRMTPDQFRTVLLISLFICHSNVLSSLAQNTFLLKGVAQKGVWGVHGLMGLT